MTRLIHDRTGELVEIDEEPQRHLVDCSGWDGEDAFGRPRPCGQCRAELAERIARQRRRDWDIAPGMPA